MSSKLTKFDVFPKLPSRGTQEPELGYPTANEEHQPFLVYETFLKILPMNFI